jgi:hypothetical protein
MILYLGKIQAPRHTEGEVILGYLSAHVSVFGGKVLLLVQAFNSVLLTQLVDQCFSMFFCYCYPKDIIPQLLFP